MLARRANIRETIYVQIMRAFYLAEGQIKSVVWAEGPHKLKTYKPTHIGPPGQCTHMCASGAHVTCIRSLTGLRPVNERLGGRRPPHVPSRPEKEIARNLRASPVNYSLVACVCTLRVHTHALYARTCMPLRGIHVRYMPTRS